VQALTPADRLWPRERMRRFVASHEGTEEPSGSGTTPPQSVIRDGAWGLRLQGPAIEGDRLLSCPGWPAVKVVISVGRPPDGPDTFDAEDADIRLFGGGRVRCHRAGMASELVLPEAPTADAIIHPHLGSTATIMNYWLGRTCFHAGAVIVGDGAWALLGHRGDGKSSSMAWFTLQGLPVLTDDILAVAGRTAFAGPRCLDLREEPATRFGIGTYLGWVGSRERWRVGLSEVSPECPLLGWVFLEWAPSLAVEPVSAGTALPRLLDFGAASLVPDPTTLLDLAALPAWAWRRPQSWDAMPGAADALIQALGG
jgi:hypothetical protein